MTQTKQGSEVSPRLHGDTALFITIDLCNSIVGRTDLDGLDMENRKTGMSAIHLDYLFISVKLID